MIQLTHDKKTKLYWFFRSALVSSVFLACAFLMILGFSMIYINMQKIGFNNSVTVLSFTDGTVNIYGFTVDLMPLRTGYQAILSTINDIINQIIIFVKGLI